MSIDEIQNEIIEEFEFMEGWEDKYKYIIDLGRDLADYPEAFRDDQHIVKGCQSRVWLHQESDGDKLNFFGDSDALIPKGLISLLLRVYSGQPASSIAATEPYFIDQIGLSQNLTPTRTNGLFSMVKKIREQAAHHSA